jgi:hypothetical protein
MPDVEFSGDMSNLKVTGIYWSTIFVLYTPQLEVVGWEMHSLEKMDKNIRQLLDRRYCSVSGPEDEVEVEWLWSIFAGIST